VIFDNVCNHSFFERRHVLNPKGICVLAGMGGAGVKGSEAIGRITGNLFAALALSAFVDQKFAQYRTRTSKQDLTLLGDFIQAGKIKPVIDRTYKLGDAVDAFRYLDEGHVRGKIIVTMEQGNKLQEENKTLGQ
jgi:NADPH:quinone reductase-like Zn-dependent oxidoreductase